MKVRDLAPLKGREAVDFIMRFGSIMDMEADILPCGCITITKNKSGGLTPIIYYIHLCPLHKILEEVNLECSIKIWRGSLFKPFSIKD